MALTVKKYRGRFAIYAGASKLSRGFSTEAAAVAELAKNGALYTYWAGSASVSIDNTPARAIVAGGQSTRRSFFG